MDAIKFIKDVCLYICVGFLLKLVLSVGVIPIMMLGTGQGIEALVFAYWYMLFVIAVLFLYALYVIFILGKKLGSGVYKAKKPKRSDI